MAAFRALTLAILLAITGALAVAKAADSGVLDQIELVGARPETIVLSPQGLAALPQIERDVSFKTSKGMSTGHYKGVLFWEVLKANKAFDGLDRNAELQETFLVTARDDYAIAFSIGEIHPDFGNTPLMIATEMDGKPFSDGLRVIVPGDTRGARNVREVVKIEMR